MSSQTQPGKPPVPPKPPLQSAGAPEGGYVSRYKLQQQRIRTLHQMESTTADLQKRIQKSLPKVRAHTDRQEDKQAGRQTGR